MTLNGVMALILRHFTKFGSFRGALRKNGWRCRRNKVHVRYLISWWVSCFNLLWTVVTICKPAKTRERFAVVKTTT